jgi:hypothetical protein
MARNRSIAGFGQVANDNDNKNNNNDIDVNTNNNINNNIDNNVNIDALLGSAEPKKEMIGIYFDADVAAVLKQLKNQGKRGAQSKVVNEAVKKLFQDKGLL